MQARFRLQPGSRPITFAIELHEFNSLRTVFTCVQCAPVYNAHPNFQDTFWKKLQLQLILKTQNKNVFRRKYDKRSFVITVYYNKLQVYRRKSQPLLFLVKAMVP